MSAPRIGLENRLELIDGIAEKYGLSDLDRKAINSIWLTDLSFVRDRLIKKGLFNESDIGEAIREYRKFMTMLRLGYENLVMFSPEVDEVWHTHIIFTRQYSNFCEEVFGHYVHHQPVSPGMITSESKEAVEAFLTAYKGVFGASSSLWSSEKPIARALCVPTGKKLCVPTVTLCYPT